jgi:hypothetical protein
VSPFRAALHLLEQKTATHKFALGQALQFSPALGEDNCKRFATRLFYSSPKPATCCNTGSRARWTGTSASSAKTSSAAHDKRGESHWPKVKVEATVKPRSPNPPRRNRLLRHQQSRHLRPGIGWDGRRSHDGEIRTTTAAHKRAAQSAPCRLAFRNAGSSPIPPESSPGDPLRRSSGHSTAAASRGASTASRSETALSTSSTTAPTSSSRKA